MNLENLPLSPTWQTDEVPKLLHQTAPADRSKWHPLWERCQRTWAPHFPEHTYKLWTDEDIDEFMRTRFPQFYPMFAGFRYQIHRVDAFRYFLLYELGGIYVDMDYECVKNFEHLLPKGKVSIAENMHWPERFQNALMASPPRHPFWIYTLDALRTCYTNQMDPSFFRSVLNTAGPGMIELATQNAPAEYINALPKKQFSFFEKEHSAFELDRTELTRLTESDIYAAHHCTVTWTKPS
jgi:mannosyltransferase OCH1-like enzyme